MNTFFMCHQKPERSFFYKGKQFPICARCTGLAIGYSTAVIVLIISGLLKFWLIAPLILPTAIDGTGQLFRIWESNNIRRLVTGILAGIGISFLFFHFCHHGFTLGQTIARNWII